MHPQANHTPSAVQPYTVIEFSLSCPIHFLSRILGRRAGRLMFRLLIDMHGLFCLFRYEQPPSLPDTIILNHRVQIPSSQFTVADVVIEEWNSLHTTNDTSGMLCPTQPQWWKIETHESSKINLQRSPPSFSPHPSYLTRTHR